MFHQYHGLLYLNLVAVVQDFFAIVHFRCQIDVWFILVNHLAIDLGSFIFT